MREWLDRVARGYEWARRPLYRSLREVVVTAVITLTPVWAGVVISLAVVENRGFFAALRLNTERGDLFILATAIIAPVTLYITVEKGDLPRPLTIHFPGGWLYMSILIVLFGISSLLFAIKRMADGSAAFGTYNSEFIYLTSVWIYILSLIVALIVAFIKKRASISHRRTYFAKMTRCS